MKDESLVTACGARDEGRGTFRILLSILFIALPVAGGLLTFLDSIYDGTGDVYGLGEAYAVASAPDGEHVYVVSWEDDALTVFRTDPAGGGLSHHQTLFDNLDGVDGLSDPLDVTASPDGEHVYVASYSDNAVSVFRRYAPTGGDDVVEYRTSVVDNSGGVFALGGASAVEVTPDGRHLLVASWDDESLLVFARDATWDDLVLVDVENQWTNTPSMGGASAIAVSPDGRHIYVSSYRHDRIVSFGWDPTQDGVAYTGVVQNGVGGVSGLSGPRDVVVDPAGSFVYASGYFDNAVVVFSRDVGNGTLSFVSKAQNGVGGIDGIAYPLGLAVSPVEDALFVCGNRDGTVTVFTRDPGTGALTQLEVMRDGVGGVHGLAGAAFLAVNPVLQQVYATGFSDSAVANFDIIQIIFADGFESGDTGAWSATQP